MYKAILVSSLILVLFSGFRAEAFFTNYNSILIGERAAGMGGAFTALTGDAAGSSFYNPAALARMEGASLSATVNLYNKYDTKFGDQADLSQAPLRINRGAITSIPSSSGSVYTFGNFAVALSVIFPDFNNYDGEVRRVGTDISTLNIRDESLWLGGSTALNITEKDAIGFTMYYTSRSYTRTMTDQFDVAGNTTLTSEQKVFAQNSLVYILGYYHQFNPNWTTGFSFRLPSISIFGRGSWLASRVEEGGAITPTLPETDIGVDSRVPAKLSWGIAYDQERNWTLALDINYFLSENYYDMGQSLGRQRIIHENVLNVNLGYEEYVRKWLAWRVGVYSNFSSTEEIKTPVTSQKEDYIHMWGLSTNFAVFTSPSSRITLGGYYSGGKGAGVQRIQDTLTRVPKTIQIFSFLVGTSFNF